MRRHNSPYRVLSEPTPCQMKLSDVPAGTIDFSSNALAGLILLPFQYHTCDGVSSVMPVESVLPTIGQRHSESPQIWLELVDVRM